MTVVGAAGGLLGGLLGVGGGVVMIPLLSLWLRLPQRRANATSLAAIIPISIVAALVYYFAGRHPQVDLRLAGLLMIGSVGGAYAGARLLEHIPDRVLKYVVAALMALVGLRELLLP